MAPTAPTSASIGLIEEPRRDAAGERAEHDEPPAGNEPRSDERDRARDCPRGGAPRAAPQRHRERGEEDRQHEVETETLGIGHEGAEPIAERTRRGPERPHDEAAAEKYRGIGTALGAVAHADQPLRVSGEEHRRIDLPGGQRAEPW